MVQRYAKCRLDNFWQNLTKFRINKCGIDLRLVINGLLKPLKRFVHQINPHNQHFTVFQNLTAEFGFNITK
jgi:hypothetical protein